MFKTDINQLPSFVSKVWVEKEPGTEQCAAFQPQKKETLGCFFDFLVLCKIKRTWTSFLYVAINRTCNNLV